MSKRPSAPEQELARLGYQKVLSKTCKKTFMDEGHQTHCTEQIDVWYKLLTGFMILEVDTGWPHKTCYLPALDPALAVFFQK
jgi:hypothetical protein